MLAAPALKVPTMTQPPRGPPPLKIRGLKAPDLLKKQAGCDRWTKSGAFVIPGTGDAGTIKVTQRGVVHKGKATSTSDAGSVSSSDAGPGAYTTVSMESDITMDRLQLIRALGSGASGDVKLAEDTVTHKLYALKRIRSAGHGNMNAKQTLKVFEEETKRMFQSSPNLVTTHQAFIGSLSTLVLVQEYMDFGSLEQLLAQCKEQNITMPEPIVAYLSREMLKGLRDLGGRYMHRDMKPGNVLLNKQGECKLADFGICSEVSTVGKSTFVGTLTYMSPERIQGGRYGTPADVWAVGLIVAEMVMGRYPFEKQNIVQVLATITGSGAVPIPDTLPPHVSAFIRCLLKRDPMQRPTATGALELPFITMHADMDSAAFAAWLRDTFPPSAESGRRDAESS